MTITYLYRQENLASKFMGYVISIGILIVDLNDTTVIHMLPLTKEGTNYLKNNSLRFV